MSEEAVIDPPEVFSATAVPLLREYQKRLIGMRDQLRELKQWDQTEEYAKDTKSIVAAELGLVQSLFKRLRPACVQLAQQVSGMIDQGRLTPLERVELQLRLAEFESILGELPRLITAYRLT